MLASRHSPITGVKSEREYIQLRELTQPSFLHPVYELTDLRDGVYAVFVDHADLVEYDLLMPGHFDGCPIVCVFGYENAFYLGEYVN